MKKICTKLKAVQNFEYNFKNKSNMSPVEDKCKWLL